MSIFSSPPRQVIQAATLAKPRPKLIAGIGLALLAGLLLWKSLYIVDAGERGVILRLGAEVEVLKVNQNAAREKVQADIAVIRTKAEAEAAEAKAEADAQAIRLRGDAEAAAITARAAALPGNPLILDLIAAERWNGALPATMVPEAALPFRDVN